MIDFNILIVGAGMYVTGRGSDSNGTILPALVNYSKKRKINIFIVSTKNSTINRAKKKINSFIKNISTNISINYFPNSKKNFNYKDIISKYDIHCAIVSVPDHIHFEICNYIGNKGIHCLVVKPMCLKTIEAKKLISCYKKNKIYGAVEFHKRFDEANISIKSLIKENRLGKLQYASITYSQKKIIPENIFKLWSHKSNVFNYLGVHYVDLIKFLTNFKPYELLAFGQKDYLASKNIHTYDSIQVMIKWLRDDKKPFVSSHLTNWIDPNSSTAMSNQYISIIGTKGRIDSDQKNRGLKLNYEDNNLDINPYFSSTISLNNELHIFGYGIKSIQNFLDNVYKLKNKKISLNYLNKHTPSFENCLDTVKIIEAVEKSLKNNKKIKV